MNSQQLTALVCVIIGIAASFAPAQPAPATQPGMASRQHRDELIARARQRMAQDRERYSPEQLRECEALYQVANNDWRSNEAVQSLNKMIEKYPDTNRTGCGALYLAQYADGKEQERRLGEVIEKYSDCRYGNGAQVGALARLLLGQIYWQTDRKDQAQVLFDQINRDFPGAITHRGLLVSERIKELTGAAPATQPAQSVRP